MTTTKSFKYGLANLETFKEYRPTMFDGKGLGSDETNGHWLVLPFLVNGCTDSYSLEQCNRDVAIEVLEGLDPEQENYSVCRFGHWGPGWFEIIIINPDGPESFLGGLDELLHAYSQYPVLSEEKYSEYELETETRDWREHTRYELVDQLKEYLEGYPLTLEVLELIDSEEFDCLREYYEPEQYGDHYKFVPSDKLKLVTSSEFIKLIRSNRNLRK